MSHSSSPTCTRCGTPIPAGATDQLCPACLMSGALKAPIDETVLMAPGQSPSRPEVTHSVSDPSDIDDEMRYLVAALRRK